MTFVRVASPRSQLRCLFCHDAVSLEAELLVCGACGALHHPECVREADPTLLTRRCCAHACGAELSVRLPPQAPKDLGGWAPVSLGLSGLGFLAGFVLTLLPGCEPSGAVLATLSFLVAMVSGSVLAGRASRHPTLGPSIRITPQPPAAPRRRCLLCPDDAQPGGHCCAPHAALVGERISSSPSARAVNPGARYGPGRLNAGWRP